MATSEKPASALRRMIDSLKLAANDARKRIDELDSQIAALLEKRAALEVALPHADDLADLVCRNIDRYRDYYFTRAARHLHPEVLRRRGWSAIDQPSHWRDGFGIFRLDTANSDQAADQVIPADPDHALVNHPIDARAIVALLADPLKAQARAFIAKLVPETANGMRGAERDAQLEAIDAQLRELGMERQDILDHIGKAARASN